MECSRYTRNDVSSIVQTTRSHKEKVEQKCHVHPEEVFKGTWLCKSDSLCRGWGNFDEGSIVFKGSLKWVYWQKRGFSKKKKKIKTYVITSNEKTSRLLNSFPLCQKDHDLDKCEDFKKKSIEDKSKFLANNKLCYGCYMSIPFDHNARSCKQRRVFTIFKKNTLQVFMVTNTQGKANWEIAVPVTMRIPWLVQQLKWSQELWACASNLLKWNMFTLERKFKHMQ